MKKIFALIYSDVLGSSKEIQEFLDSRSEILSWRIELPNCVFLLSESDTVYLSGLVRGFDRGNASFLILEITGNKQGWLSTESWKFLKGEIDTKSIEEDIPF